MAKKNSNITIYKSSEIQKKNFSVRNEQVIVDNDLAEFYAIKTKALNQAVKRNYSRLPNEFMFQITDDEWESLRFQFGTINDEGLRTRNVILEKEEEDIENTCITSLPSKTLQCFWSKKIWRSG